MPKNHKGSKATGRVAGYLEDKVCLAQGRTYVTNTGIAQYEEIPVTPQLLGDRAVAIADLYGLWRPKSLRFRATPLTTGALVCVGHRYPNSYASGVTTMEEFVDLPACKFGNGLFGSPLPDLLLEEPYWRANAMPQWYTTSTLPTDPELEKAGAFVYGNATSTFATHNFLGVIEWELEFKCMLDPTVSLSRLQQRLNAAANPEIKVEEGYIKCANTCPDKNPDKGSPPTDLVVSLNGAAVTSDVIKMNAAVQKGFGLAASRGGHAGLWRKS